MLPERRTTLVCGPSNCGKTFFVTDLCAAIVRGALWMGRKTEEGIVLYLAAESPISLRLRLEAYQKHHGVVLPYFAVVQNPVNLFKDDKDEKAIIETARMLEYMFGKKVRLIVCDTLARVSAGANENAGLDMGRIIESVDRIRDACKAHVLLIHHTGKQAEAGARGWSGLTAAVDTEIRVVATATGRYAEITKDRDLGVKGERIGFALETVELGVSKWGDAVTSCVVVPAPAPKSKPASASTKGRRRGYGGVEGAIVDFLSGKPSVKGDVVTHLARYASSTVYRAIKELIAEGVLAETGGLLTLTSTEGSTK
jgi:putative DNA primase/helicase